MTVIEKTGVAFFLLLFVLLTGALAWSFLTESGQARREEAQIERGKSESLRLAGAEKKKLAMVRAGNAADAWHACREFAEPKLGPAKTRTWSSQHNAQVIGEYVLAGVNRYRVRGYVLSFAGNLAGDAIRTRVDCTLTEVSLDEWTLDNLVLE